MNEYRNLTRKERRRLEDRQSIIDAATELFAQKGFTNVSMSEIATRADFAVGTLYKFFKTKDDLYKDIFLHLVNDFMTHTLELLEENLDPLTLLRNHMEFSAQTLLQHQELIQLYFVEVYSLASHACVCQELGLKDLKNKIIAAEMRILEAGIRVGQFRNVSPKALQIAFSGMFEAFLLDWINDPNRDPKGLDTQLMLDIFLNGAVRTGDTHEK